MSALVTRPIESLLSGTPGVETVRSTSGIGFAMVVAEFEWATDITLARVRVNERLGVIQAQLPAGVVPQMASLSSIMGEILLIALTAEPAAATAMELREIADFVLRPQVLAVPGVTTFISIGGEVRQYRVTPIPLEMHHLKVSSDKILEALRRFGTNSSGGFLDQQSREYLVRNVGLTTSLEDLRNTVVDTHGGRSILLRQIASVDFAPRVRRGDAGYNGRPAVIVSIQKQPGADTLALTRQIERVLSDAQKTMPPGVKIDQIQFRQATFIETSIANLEKSPGRSGDRGCLRARRVSRRMHAQPSSRSQLFQSRFSFTVIVFQAFGLTINTMTLGGLAIAIGALVDDAVVDVENILRQAQGKCTAGAASPCARGHRRGKPGGALGHRLRHLYHHPGILAALRAVGDRRAPVHAAGHCLRGLDHRLARHLDHGYARSQLLSAARVCDPLCAATGQALSCAP